jgi:plasmid stability protein
LTNTIEFDRQSAQTGDERSLIKARYCRSILKVAAISTEHEARILLNGLSTEQVTTNTSAAMAEAERAALTAIRDLAGYQHGRSVPQTSSEWMRAARAIQLWLNVHDQ